MQPPTKYQARLTEKYYLGESKKFLLAKFEFVKPYELNFLAGQYVSLRIGEGSLRRSYSIVSTPDTKHGFSLLVEMVPNGLGSAFLAQLALGQEVEVLAPLGRFVVARGETMPKRIFVATGSGIVPVWSMINDLLINQHETSPIRLHWGMRQVQDLFWMDNLERLRVAYPNFVYDVVLSRPESEWSLCSGHVQDCLERDFGTIGLEGWEGYVCGNPTMVSEVRELLLKLRMNESKVYHEKFT